MTTDYESNSPTFQQQIEMTKPQSRDAEERLIRQAVLRLNVHVMGFVFGLIGALIIFAATNWLVLKGGEVVGPHLGLLDNFFIGYSVTFIGSLVGAAYAFVLGYIGGMVVAWLYNLVIKIRSSE